ncbi:hypothetical protein [Lacticaseibacillus daqingensis]|uniref:hypothetical protein n=1 Tax=Lacticaseibacillus daqingensis TaxID=2486014 RepID=UPI000F777DDB|nr:hypothetical protein [Lacticaseibacillus daqingensis]
MQQWPALDVTVIAAMDAQDPTAPACLITVITEPPDLRVLHLQIGATTGWGFAAPAHRLTAPTPVAEALRLIAAFVAAPTTKG